MKCTKFILHVSVSTQLALAGCLEHAEQQQTACNINSLAALGDSYSAGLQSRGSDILPICAPGQYGGFYAPQCTNITCGRDTAAYGYQFAQQQGLINSPNFGYIACSGANTTNITVQANYIIDQPDLITLNLGGDNNGIFANVVKACVYERFDHHCSKALAAANATIQGIQPALTSVLKNTLRARFPNAKIAVMGYAQFWASGTNYSAAKCQKYIIWKFNIPEYEEFNQLVVNMNAQLAIAAAAANAYYVDADSQFAGNRFCESSGAVPYFHYKPSFGNPKAVHYDQGVFHPTVDGQQAYLRALNQALGCGSSVVEEPKSQFEIQLEL